MQVESLLEIINADFYTGVPDSQLKALCDCLMQIYGIDSRHHMIAANEGNCVGLAAGYNLATGKMPVVYMQNSGIGNAINPIISLLDRKVYAIPVLFIIGWRGEPGIHDEPQHIFQGEITIKLLRDLGIETYVIGSDTKAGDVKEAMQRFREILSAGKSAAFVVRKGALTYEKKVEYKNNYSMTREQIIEKIVETAGEDPIICTTGKASRELFEIRERNKMSHDYDFLTVGSMGHASSIALGVAINKPNKRIWCIDGDGALLMHMGAMGVIGSTNINNLVHIVINNGAHETVGGMPTVSDSMDLCEVARGCGYTNTFYADDEKKLISTVENVKHVKELCFIEIMASIGARKNLGRPTCTPVENKLGYVRSMQR